MLWCRGSGFDWRTNAPDKTRRPWRTWMRKKFISQAICPSYIRRGLPTDRAQAIILSYRAYGRKIIRVANRRLASSHVCSSKLVRGMESFSRLRPTECSRLSIGIRYHLRSFVPMHEIVTRATVRHQERSDYRDRRQQAGLAHPRRAAVQRQQQQSKRQR